MKYLQTHEMGERRQLTSAVWSYFIKNPDNTAQCSFCHNQMKCKGSSTSGLLRHLQNIHGIDIQANSNSQTAKQVAGPSNKRNHIDEYNGTKKLRASTPESFEAPQHLVSEMLARFVAQDNIPIKTISQSYYINQFFLQNGLTMPKSESDILNHVLNFHKDSQFKMKTEIQQLLNSNCKFSLSLNVMYNLQNRQFFKVIIHDNKVSTYCLGLLYFSAEWDGREIVNIVRTLLSKFDISLENHVVALATNEQKIKSIFEEETQIETLLCLNDALHEAVLDIIFTKNTENQTESSDSDTDYSYFYQNEDNEYEKPCFLMKENFRNIISKVRKIVKLYQDPLKNSNLQNFVKLEHGSELKLILDKKYNWNDTILMIERFLELKECVHNSLININMKYLWDEMDTSPLDSLLFILNSIKIAVEALNRQDTTIPSADIILNTLLRKLQNMDDFLAKEMYMCLINKINERREEKLYCLVKYLKYPDSILFSGENNEVGICSKASILAYAEKMFNRLFEFSKSEIYYTPEYDNEIYTEEDNKPTKIIKCSIKIDLEKEFQLFEDTGKRSEHLDLLYNALLTIKPTVTSSAKVFSTSLNYRKEIRNKLPTEIASALIFLKDYFVHNKPQSSLSTTLGKVLNKYGYCSDE